MFFFFVFFVFFSLCLDVPPPRDTINRWITPRPRGDNVTRDGIVLPNPMNLLPPAPRNENTTRAGVVLPNPMNLLRTARVPARDRIRAQARGRARIPTPAPDPDPDVAFIAAFPQPAPPTPPPAPVPAPPPPPALPPPRPLDDPHGEQPFQLPPLPLPIPLPRRLTAMYSAHRDVLETEMRLQNRRPPYDVNLRFTAHIEGLIHRHLQDENRGAIMNHEVIGYAFASHDYLRMDRLSRVRLNLIRLDIERSISVQHQQEMQNGFRQPDEPFYQHLCIVCYEGIGPQTEVMSTVCGHIYCRRCFTRLQNNCGHCRSNLLKPDGPFPIFFRFNNRNNAICRGCLVEYEENSPIFARRCGDTFCLNCFNSLGRECPGCGKSPAGWNDGIRIRTNFVN